MSRRAVALVAAVVLGLAPIAGCAGGGDAAATAPEAATVLAAASLTDVLPAIVPGAAYGFAASDTLATQVREGAPADVYAAADERLPVELAEEGLVEPPTVFATNRLVLLVRPGDPEGVAGVGDLREGDVRFVMAAEGVPAGDYTREVLRRLGAEDLVGRAASQEDDVRAVVGKVALGEADAGFAYATDAAAVAGEVDVVELPAAAQPPIRYGIAVIADAGRPAAARAFVGAVLSERGRRALEAAGFGVP